MHTMTVPLSKKQMVTYESWQKVVRALAAVGGYFLMLAMLVIVVDVTLRFFFNSPIKGATESIALLMPYVVFGSFSITLLLGQHVRMTLISDRLPAKTQLVLDIIGSAVGALAVGVLTYNGWMLFWKSLLINEPLMAQVFLPIWAGKLAMPIGLAIFTLQYVAKLIMSLGNFSQKAAVAQVENIKGAIE
jgi:TRAP-type C4-dicarboxylate transport system permease small subunit